MAYSEKAVASLNEATAFHHLVVVSSSSFSDETTLISLIPPSLSKLTLV